MRKLLQFFIIAVISCCVSTSCEKAGGIGSMEDLVGTYSVTVEENVVWGGYSETIHDKGIITIIRLDKNRVQLNGLISTQGELIDGKLYLNSKTDIDTYGYLTTNYNSVIFGAGILTIWSKTSGQLSTTPNGTRYPFSNLCYFEGHKVE
ncbi:MAG: hypothetical protein IJO17_05565 [Alistipes sp.]|nr:hypothetical protein [Alistipes sp.]